MEISGHNDERFARLKDEFAANLESGEEVGAAVAVDIDGELVVDLWGGHRDAARTLPWDRDTIVNVWESEKGFHCQEQLPRRVPSTIHRHAWLRDSQTQVRPMSRLITWWS